MYTVGIDIGGTFTDFALVNNSDGSIALYKELTTTENPAVGALEGCRQILAENDVVFEEIETVIHGTTLVSNTIINKSGATTGLLTTNGMKDVLELRRGWRYDVYDWQLEYPDPIVPRNRSLQLDERINADGDVLTPLDPSDVRTKIDSLVDNHSVESIAVSLLHAYESDEHEQAIGEILADEYPDISFSLSSEIAPIIREYERTSTTVLNAYVAPILDGYLSLLESGLQADGFQGEMYLMTSSGGIVDTTTAIAEPIRLVESGPAAGVLANRIFGDAHNASDIFSFDMGGTTAKGAIIEDGDLQMTDQTDIAREHRFKPGSGYDIVIPMIDITEIGAGGGSIASIDESTGFIDVGPESSGSDPGPICYDRGGTAPTLTDAALLLGYVDPSRFTGGQMDLAVQKTCETFREKLAEPLDESVTEVAWRVFEVVCENMANAFRQHTSSRGIDPRGICMVAIGGAGPMTAFSVARKVGIEEIICPYGAGVGSSIGLIEAPKLYENSSTRRAILSEVGRKTMVSELNSLYARAKNVLMRAGADPEELKTDLSLDMRHLNQGHEIKVPFPDTNIDGMKPEVAREQFQKTYRQLFNRDILDLPIEVINYRVEVQEPSTDSITGRHSQRNSMDADIASRDTYFGEYDQVTATVYRWPALSKGDSFEGPAVIEADQSTVVVDPDAHVNVSDGLDLKITVG